MFDILSFKLTFSKFTWKEERTFFYADCEYEMKNQRRLVLFLDASPDWKLVNVQNKMFSFIDPLTLVWLLLLTLKNTQLQSIAFTINSCPRESNFCHNSQTKKLLIGVNNINTINIYCHCMYQVIIVYYI